MTVKLTSKNQLTIPVKLLRAFKISSGDSLPLRETDSGILIETSTLIIDRLSGSVTPPTYLQGIPAKKILEMARTTHTNEVVVKMNEIH